MTSIAARNSRLSQETLDAYDRYGAHPQNQHERLHFYLAYFRDVVPSGITLRHTPAERAPNKNLQNTREEIELLTPSEQIFMSGLISMEGTIALLETIAGDEAYTNWLEGCVVPDDGHWRFFTGIADLRFYKGHHDDWDRVCTFHPILEEQEVTAYLQQEYNSLICSRSTTASDPISDSSQAWD